MLIFPISAKSLILQKHIERIKVTTMTMMDNGRAGDSQPPLPLRKTLSIWRAGGKVNTKTRVCGKKVAAWCGSHSTLAGGRYVSCGNYCFDFIRANRLYGCQL